MTNYPPYRIETDRMVIRCWELRDSYLLHDAIANNTEHLKQFMPFIQREPLEIEDRMELLRRFRSNFDSSSDFTFAILNKSETKVLGSTGLHTRPGKYGYEIGYWIVKDECNKGIATEVVKALLFVGFNVLNIDRIEIWCNPENINSRKIPEKFGFNFEGIRRRINTAFENEFRDSMIWVKFRNEYVKSLNNYKIELRCFDGLNRKIKINYD